jgi:colicin import membrane protein
MRANSPSSVVISLIIHAFVAAVIFFTTIYVAQQEKPPFIVELVAGPPTAPEQLVAPALGNTTEQVKVTIPAVEPPKVQQETPKAVEPEVREVSPPTPPEVVKPAPTVKPKPDVSIAKQIKKAEKVSYQQYLKSHPTPKPAPPSTNTKASNVPRVDATGIANGVRGGSTTNTKGGGGGKALTREEQNERNTYISFLLQALKEAHEPPPGVSDQLEAQVTFDITASGAILNPRIKKSSGNKEFDDSVLAAFRKIRSIGPTPNGKADTWTVGFKMKDEG